MPDGRTWLAPRPGDVAPGHHCGPALRACAWHQSHSQRVTPPLLLAPWRQWGIDISAGQLSRLLTEGQEVFHPEKEELLPAGLAVAPDVGADDTAARHRAQNGSWRLSGNDWFASFERTDSKSRRNFLGVLRQPHTDYAVNAVAVASWQRPGLAQALVEALAAGVASLADAAAWNARLKAAGVAGARRVRSATQGALLGSLIAHGVWPELVSLSDGAAQVDVFGQASCWRHAGRPLARRGPYSEEQRRAIAGVRRRIGELSQDLKA